MNKTLSAFVITYNRPDRLRACLKAARFADELIVVDKGSDFGPTELIARELADRYVPVAWSPTVEETRAAALALCRGTWILALDDDEILSPACAAAFRVVIAEACADVVAVPMKHYILGRHDPRAGYWPEYRPCLFRRGTVEFCSTVHRGVTVAPTAVQKGFALDGPVYIQHLSHENVSCWIEKTNRYTDQPDRIGVRPSGSLAEFALKALQSRCDQVPNGIADDTNGGRRYLEAIAVLRGIYDMVDGLKRWEETQPNGAAAFRTICDEILAR
jgi:glycosyltransferase involved in cell wall biosynthesis